MRLIFVSKIVLILYTVSYKIFKNCFPFSIEFLNLNWDILYDLRTFLVMQEQTFFFLYNTSVIAFRFSTLCPCLVTDTCIFLIYKCWHRNPRLVNFARLIRLNFFSANHKAPFCQVKWRLAYYWDCLGGHKYGCIYGVLGVRHTFWDEFSYLGCVFTVVT